ncbi:MULTISPECIES: hypothetical protein [unclassified Caballeronia]|uniref:hypothetical protein n=1 Tax=unclassified Caballeronia TaxID=2646786 RepID=UPI001F1A2C3B|nr:MULTISPECIES: hypothetical protein [unclassified Caballeronia]MCE4543914.1 hypothetical protein [Caballeronia sp. PC1]MCE4571066.1 hypothetical protein [Caballeronia sp. CLC5]
MRKLIHDRDVSGDGSDDLSMTKQSIEKRSHALIALDCIDRIDARLRCAAHHAHAFLR